MVLLLKRQIKLLKKDKKGDALEIDVDYPKELHKKHNELPYLVERIKESESDNRTGEKTSTKF